MLKSVVFYILLWHEISEFSSRAHPSSTDTRVLNLTAPVSPKIIDTDVQNKPRAIYNLNNYANSTQIFYTNCPMFGTTAPTTEPTTAPTTEPTTNPGPGYVVTKGIGAHKLHTEARTWNEARQICINEGGDLAVIKSDAEEKIVLQMATDTQTAAPFLDVCRLWIGFRNPFAQGFWVSVLLETLVENGWEHWYSDNEKYSGRKCACYYWGGTKHGMTSLDCHNERYFVCKKDYLE